jgi:hypothetical protein
MDVSLLEIGTDVYAKCRECSVEMGLDSACGYAKGQRDVCFGQIAEIAQDERLALASGQTDKSRDERYPQHDVVRLISFVVDRSRRRSSSDLVEGLA